MSAATSAATVTLCRLAIARARRPVRLQTAQDIATTCPVNGQSGFANGSGGILGFSRSVGELFIASDTQAAGTFALAGLACSGYSLFRRRCAR